MTTARVHVKRARKPPALRPARGRSAFLAGARLATAYTSSAATATPLAEIERGVFLKLVWRM